MDLSSTSISVTGVPLNEPETARKSQKKSTRRGKKKATRPDKTPTFEGVTVKGAREHNLKNLDIQIPRNQITVITGLSGSGKSSLAFDTIYAEGQRRYVESLSSYARNFLEQMKKPEVDSITGLSPSIAIDQKTISHNPRSTVGTVTEVYDYLRLLYARVGVPNCPIHKIPVSSQTPQQVVEDVLKMPKGTKFYVLAPVARSKKGEFMAEFQRWMRKGFVRARIDGKWVELAEAKKLAKRKSHNIDLLVDRLVVKPEYEARLKESINLSLSSAEGLVAIEVVGKEPKIYSIHRACPECGYSFPEVEPRLLSFNNPRGACETCHGLGTIDLEDEDLEVEDADMGEEELDEYALAECPDCHGTRLRPEALNIYLGEKNIAEASALPVSDLLGFVKGLKLESKDKLIGEKVLKQVISRVEYLCRVGTGYLSLSRPSRTLSGGEAQRIRLATQVGSAMIGVLYVLDEPSIGLHPRDHHRLLEILQEIRSRGNTILMVEHDEDTIRGADHVIDLGPRAGRLGGELMAVGAPQEIANSSTGLTSDYLSGRKKIEIPKDRRQGNGTYIALKGASGNNLKDVTLKLPLGTLCGVTGVSGSGKSTLIVDTLYRMLAAEFYGSSKVVAPYESVEGLENIDKVIEINQRPIGRTPRSVPATYVGLFPLIRDLYAKLPESKIRGYRPGHFSFNVKGGRCEECQGAGMIRVEMHFLSDVFVRCETCQGRRYNREVLNIHYRGKSIADVLEMDVEEAEEFFRNHKLVHRKLETLNRVGLDYITLGQSSTTLSGGEAQRVKLSRELSKRSTGKTLYILDEPTTGLHWDDVRRLVSLLQELVDQGNTVLVIEHHLDVIKSCDHVIDLGPEGGRLGGEIVAEGTPEQVASVKKSETGKFLKKLL